MVRHWRRICYYRVIRPRRRERRMGTQHASYIMGRRLSYRPAIVGVIDELYDTVLISMTHYGSYSNRNAVAVSSR